MSHWDWLTPLRRRGIRGALDVGANVGGWIPTWLDLGATRVVAVEPVPDQFEQLARNYWHDPRVECVRLGVSDVIERRDNLSVHGAWSLAPAIGRGSPTDHVMGRALEYVGKPPFSVEFDTIEAILSTRQFRPDFIKIDTDGYDAKAIGSAYGYLEEARPMIMLELSCLPHLLGDCCERMIQRLYRLGYRLQRITDGKAFATSLDVMAEYPWRTSWDVLCWPRGEDPAPPTGYL